MRNCLLLVGLPLLTAAQSLPIWLGKSMNLLDPAIDDTGSVVLFAAATTPDGVPDQATNLYVFRDASPVTRLTAYIGLYPAQGVTSLTMAGGRAAFGMMPANGTEEVHTMDLANGLDRKVASYADGCPQPLCLTCFQACVSSVHLSPDGATVLYSVRNSQPLRTVRADGAGPAVLPVYGGLAASPQRVISRDEQFVFTSVAPSGPTGAPAPSNVYVMNLDGTGMRQVTHFLDSNSSATQATISADGSLIAFLSNYSPAGPGNNDQVWVVRADGTGLRQFSAGPDSVASPSISADGSVVVFWQSGQVKRVRTDADGEVLSLTNLSLFKAGPLAVSGDGNTVVFLFGPDVPIPAAIHTIPTDRATGSQDFQPVYAPRFVNAGGVASAAGVLNAPSPGGLISIYGVNFVRDEITAAKSLPLGSSLAGLSVLVNGRAIPLLAVTPWQINAQLPQSIAAGTATFQVRYTDGTTLPVVSAEVVSFAPGDFGGRGVSALHAGTGIPADLTHPATAGETLEIYCTGLGVTEPMVEAGVASPANPLALALQIPQLRIGAKEAQVTFAGLAPGLAGVYQVNVVVPSGLAPGLQGLFWQDAHVSYSTIGIK